MKSEPHYSQLDDQDGKPSILQIYLNRAEWGECVFGAEAATPQVD